MGRPGHARDRQPAGLADDLRADARARAATSTRSPTRSRPTGFTDAVLLGMGGSSLGPEVIRRSFGEIQGGLRLHVLDSTDPGAVLELERRSTSTRRSSSSRRSRAGRSRRCRTSTTSSSAAATTAASSSPSPTRAARSSSCATSAASGACSRTTRTSAGATRCCRYFGLVPAALMGVDVEALLHRAQVAEQNCAQLRRRARATPGLWLGLVMGELALQGRDKPTFVVSEPIASFGLWVEQLIAESTGKEGKGILPVADEPLGEPGRLRRRPRVRLPAQRRRARRGARRQGRGAGAGRAPDAHAGRARRDRPRAHLLLRRVRRRGRGLGARHQPVRPAQRAGGQGQHQQGARGRRRCPRSDPGDLARAARTARAAALRGHPGLRRSRPSEFDAAIDRAARGASASARRRTTTFGYGPRFLHSTGQLHKGGPPTGLFLQLVHDGDEDVEIPEAGYTFGT